MDVTIKQLTVADTDRFRELLCIYETVFEWSDFSLPGNPYLEQLLSNPTFLGFVAIHDGKTVGGLTAHVLQRYDSEKPSAYIYDLGVSEELQRQGIGKKLIAAVSAYCKANGFSEMFVQAETDDEQAVNFYRKTPVTAELAAIHFTYSFDEGIKNKP